MNLSPSFTLDEFLVSQTAARHDISMAPSQYVIDNLTRLCETILQPLRDDLGVPIVITSGWRPEELNRLIGGSETSQHIHGEAADIRAVGKKPAEVVTRIQYLDLTYHQLIHEFGQWTHVSVPPQGIRPKRETLTALKEGGRTVYKAGLVA